MLSEETPSPSRAAAPAAVEWDDIVGQAKAKAALREAIELPIRHAEIYRRYGRKPTKGVLLFGPPGNGKTLLARAAATSITRLYGAQVEGSGPRSFISVKGPELNDKYHGETERKIRSLFAEARSHKARYGFPSVIFLDEGEALLADRGGRNAWGANITVPTFLAEMDGTTESSAIVIIATNRPDDIDPAILRDGRIDRRIHVGRPDRTDARALLLFGLKSRPLADGVTVDALAEAACDALFDTRHGLYRVHLEEGLPKTIALLHVVSHAQIVGLVERATSRAIEREIAGGTKGLSLDDFTSEVASTLEESRARLHSEEIAEFCGGLRAKVRQVERIVPRKDHDTQ